jgi:hypothetical protein
MISTPSKQVIWKPSQEPQDAEFHSPLAVGTVNAHIIPVIIGKILLTVLGVELRQMDYPVGSKTTMSKKTRMAPLML